MTKANLPKGTRVLAEELLVDEWARLTRYTLEVERRDGITEKQIRQVYDRGNGAAILPIDRGRGMVLLVRQFRMPVALNPRPGHDPDGTLLEVCAGLLDANDPETAIRKEAEEELGYRFGAITKVFDTFMSPGSVSERLSLFVTEYTPADRISDGGGAAAEGEEIDVIELPVTEAMAMVASGDIADGKTIMLLQWVALNDSGEETATSQSRAVAQSGMIRCESREGSLDRIAGLLKSAVAFFATHGAEARLAVRVAVAGVITFALGHIIGLQQGYWAVFTAVIVIQASVGGSVKATVDRLIGTLGGAVYGGAIAMVVANAEPVTIGIALVVALLPLAFIAAIDARFRVAPVTAVIVLISPFGQQVSPLWFTLDRIAEIGLGSIVALVVSLLVLPARAHNLLTDTAAKLTGLYADFLALLLAGVSAPIDAAELRRQQVATRRTVVTLEGIADEAQRERSAHLTDDPDPEPIARTSLRIRNDLIMLARAVVEPLPPQQRARLAPLTQPVAAAGVVFLRGLSDAFANGSRPPSTDAIDAALRAYHAEIAAMRGERALSELDGDRVARLFALGFALDLVRKDIGDLADRAAEYARPDAGSAA